MSDITKEELLNLVSHCNSEYDRRIASGQNIEVADDLDKQFYGNITLRDAIEIANKCGGRQSSPEKADNDEVMDGPHSKYLPLWSDRNNVDKVLGSNDIGLLNLAVFNLYEDINCLKELASSEADNDRCVNHEEKVKKYSVYLPEDFELKFYGAETVFAHCNLNEIDRLTVDCEFREAHFDYQRQLEALIGLTDGDCNIYWDEYEKYRAYNENNKEQ